MATQPEIVSRMLAALGRTDPELDTSVGTPTRKILDAVAESISEAYVDSQLLSYQYDIDTKIGADLDDFVGLFGFTRLPKQRATGVVVFSRDSTSASRDAAYIPANTQIVALRNPPVYVQTVLPASMSIGQVSVDVPVQAVEGGVRGNVPASTLTTLVTATTGVTAVINPDALSGGTEMESDAQLRARFKATVFRSLAGTEQMYTGLALEVPGLGEDQRAVSKVNVVSATKTYTEQIQVVGGTASTTVDDPAFIYTEPVFVGQPQTPATDDDPDYIYKIPGQHFSWTVNNGVYPPTGTLQSLSGGLPDGVYDLTFEYMPRSSRNDPAKGISNRVDVYVNGLKPVEAHQVLVFPAHTTDNQFSDTTTHPLYRGGHDTTARFVRKATLTRPAAGNYFIPLAFGPLIAIPDSITVTISGTPTTFTEGTHYWLVERADAFGGMSTSQTGIEWAAANALAAGTVLSIFYSYNSVPREVEERIQQWRLLGTDARVHQGKQFSLRFNLAVMYERTHSPATVKADIDTALAAFINGLGFRSTVQVSDVLQVVHNVPGVDNVRFVRKDENGSAYGIQHMLGSTVYPQLKWESDNRPKDIIFGDGEIPTFHSTTVVTKAANTFGTL